MESAAIEVSGIKVQDKEYPIANGYRACMHWWTKETTEENEPPVLYRSPLALSFLPFHVLLLHATDLSVKSIPSRAMIISRSLAVVAS